VIAKVALQSFFERTLGHTFLLRANQS
jgi:hypothetical protein